MTISFNVRRSRDTQPLNIKGTKDFKYSGSHALHFDVEVLSDDDAFDPRDISEADVYLQADVPGHVWPNGRLPSVNRSIYVFGDYYVPYWVCRSKTIKRDPNKRNWFTAQCNFEFEGEDEPQQQTDPEELPTLTPKVESSIEEVTFVLYKDYSTPAKDILTPTGNWYAEPTLTRQPCLTLTITQYENAMTFQQQLDRSLRCNSTEYRSRDRYMWLSEPVQATEVQLDLPNMDPVTAVQAIYKLRLSPFEWGWKEARVLIDSQYRPTPGAAPVPFRDNLIGSRTTGFIQANGTRKTGTTPDYDYFEAQRTIDFNSFLRA